MNIIQEIVSSSQLGGLNILIQFSVDNELELSKAIEEVIEEVRKRIIEVSGDEPSGWSNEDIISSIRKLNRITRMPINENTFSINLYEEKLKTEVDWLQIPEDNHSLFRRCQDAICTRK